MDAVASEISLVERSSRCAIHIFTQTRFLEVTIYSLYDVSYKAGVHRELVFIFFHGAALSFLSICRLIISESDSEFNRQNLRKFRRIHRVFL